MTTPKEKIEEHIKQSQFYSAPVVSGHQRPNVKVKESGKTIEEEYGDHGLTHTFVRGDGRVYWYSHEGMTEVTDHLIFDR